MHRSRDLSSEISIKPKDIETEGKKKKKSVRSRVLTHTPAATTVTPICLQKQTGFLSHITRGDVVGFMLHTYKELLS